MSAEDSGLYVIWLQLPASIRIEVGALGHIEFAAGYYGYVGTAQRNRAARVARHLRIDKSLRWHLDYLRPRGTVVAVSYADGSQELECVLASRICGLARARIAYPRFGASDCRCAGHLIYFPQLPDLGAVDRSVGTCSEGYGSRGHEDD